MASGYHQQKVACGLFHTISIGNLNPSAVEPQYIGRHGETELYVWGRNTNTGFGIGEKEGSQLETSPQKVPKTVFAHRDGYRVDPIEVACGSQHSLVVAKLTRQQDEEEVPGADAVEEYRDVFVFGSQDHGRLGIHEKPEGHQQPAPGHPGQKPATPHVVGKPMNMTEVYVVKKPMKKGVEVTSAPGMPYYDDHAIDRRDDINMATWDTLVRGTIIKTKDPHSDHEMEWLYTVKPTGLKGYLRTHMDDISVLERLQVLRVACGSDHSLCVCAPGGLLVSWGMNNMGQCGVGSFTDVWEPTVVHLTLPRNVVQVAAGGMHSLAIDEGGQVYSWGCSQQGRLGLGISDHKPTPQVVSFEGGMTALYVAAGEAHSGAIDVQKKVWMWGAGAHGRLGLGELLDIPAPRMVDIPGEIKIHMLALGGFHSLAVSTAPQRLFTWGFGPACGQGEDSGTITAPRAVRVVDQNEDLATSIRQISAGVYHSLLLLEDGRLLVFGTTGQGRLGVSQQKHHRQDVATPTILRLGRNTRFGFATKLKTEHGAKVSLIDDGHNAGPEEDEDEKGHTKSPWFVSKVACGMSFTVALTYGGMLYVWGDGKDGKLGMKLTKEQWAEQFPGYVVNEPTRLTMTMRVQIKDVAAGYFHCLAITTNGNLLAWGRGESGQLGTGHSSDAYTPQKVEEKFLPGMVVRCAAGEEHSAAIVRRLDGVHIAYTWGSTDLSKLGYGEGASVGKTQPYPREVERTWGDESHPVEVSCSQFHTALIVCSSDSANPQTVGSVWTFGGGLYGRLGIDESQRNHASPKRVNVPPVLAVACGPTHTCAIVAPGGKHLNLKDNGAPPKAGSLWWWGQPKRMCEQGDGVTVPCQPTPKKFNAELIPDADKVRSVVCCSTHTIVTLETGEIYAWGENANGQLGIQQVGASGVPRPEVISIPGLVEDLAAGATHTVALLLNGDVYAWGNQSGGRLGLQMRMPERLVRVPQMVKAAWASIEGMTAVEETHNRARLQDDGQDDDDKKSSSSSDSSEEGEDSSSDSDKDEDKQERMLQQLKSGKITHFSTIQSLLKREPDDCRETKLRVLAQKTESELQRVLKDIQDVPNREAQVLQLQTNITQSLGQNLKFFKSVRPPEPASYSHTDLPAKLALFEKVVWALQQQPEYLTVLGTLIDDSDQETFDDIVCHIFAGLEEPRTLHLFISLVRQMMQKDVEHAKDISEVFQVDSPVCRIFASFALKPVFYSHHLHPLLNRSEAEPPTPIVWIWSWNRTTANVSGKEKSKAGKGPSLGSRLVDTVLSDQKQYRFALTQQEYEENWLAEHTTRLNKSEARQGFMNGLDNLKEFMLKDFITAMREWKLHPKIRKLLVHSKEQIIGRNYSQTGDQRIAADLMPAIPLLFLVIKGIIMPILLEPMKYAGKHTFMPKKCTKDLDQETVQRNMKVVATFLDVHMLQRREDPSDQSPATRILRSTATTLHPQLLRWMVEQTNVVDDIDTHLIVDTIVTHYDRTPSTVSMPASLLAKLSNMLSRYRSSLYQSQDDVVDKWVQEIGPFDNSVIEGFTKDPVKESTYNLAMNKRWLFNDQWGCCLSSKCPMPRYLQWIKQSAIEASTVLPSPAGDPAADEEAKVEELLREVGDVQANTFSGLSEEFDKMLLVAMSRTPPMYAQARKLTEGKRVVEEWGNLDTAVVDVLNSMSKKYIDRNYRRVLLKQLKKGRVAIRLAQREHAKEVKASDDMLQQVLRMSTMLSLPESIRQLAESNRTELRFTRAQNHYKRGGKGGIGSDRVAFEKTSFSPTKEYPLDVLKADGIVVDVEDGMKRLWKGIKVRFYHHGEDGVDVVMSAKPRSAKYYTILKQLKIDSAQLQELRRCQDEDVVKLPSEVQWSIVFRTKPLMALITHLQTGLGSAPGRSRALRAVGL